MNLLRAANDLGFTGLSFALALAIAGGPSLAREIDSVADANVSASATSGTEIAQLPDPNRERFLQPTPDVPAPLPTEEEPLKPAPPTDFIPPQIERPDLPVEVSSIEVVGSTIFDRSDFLEFIQDLEGRTVTLGELNNAANEITQLYLSQGYITTRAILPPQEVVDGIVQIQVVEGSLEDIEIEGAARLGGYTRKRIRLGTSTPVRVGAVEDRLLLLQADPRIENIKASLQPGDEPGQSKLLVNLEEAFPFRSNLSFDNYSIPSVGSQRYGIGISHLNVFGIGDTFAFDFFNTTTNESQIYDISYTIPVNSNDGTVQLRTLIQRNDSEIDIPGLFTQSTESNSERYEISFRQPMIRSIREEFALSLGFSYRTGSTLVSTPLGGFPSPDEDTSIFRFGQDYLRRDRQGVWFARSQFSLGTGLFDAVTDADPFTDADGEFFSWLGQFQRVQLAGDKHTIIIQTDLQLTPDSLLPSEQFVVGGGQSVRGYRQNARTGDNGVRFSIEDRITLVRDEGRPMFQLIPFFNLGHVWNHPDNFDIEDQFIAAAGLGFLWQPLEGIAVKFEYGVPFVDLDFVDDSLQDDGIHFSFVMQPESFR